MIWHRMRNAYWSTSFARQAIARTIAPVMRQFTSLLRAGVPVVQALQHLEDAVRDKTQRAYIHSLQDAAAAGTSLASVWSSRLPLLLVMLLTTGEHTGGFADAIQRWGIHFARMVEWRRTCVRLLTYPLCLTIFSVALMGFLSNQVLPAFTQMDTQFGGPPSAVVGQWEEILSGFRQLLMMIGVCGVLTAVLFPALRKYAPGVWVHIRPRIPGYRLLKMWRTRVFCMLVGILVQAGIPVLDAVAQIQRIQSRGWISAAAGQVEARLLSGERLTTAFEGEWDATFITLLRTAEQTGELAEALLETERITGEELAYRLHSITRVAQPVLTFLSGGMVTLTMLALYAPMYDMVTQISGGGIT